MDRPPVPENLRVEPHPEHPEYWACENGDVWSRCYSRWGRLLPWRKLKAFPDAIGYLMVRLDGLTMKVHRVILETFVGKRPDGMHCRHLDGDMTNNQLSNLRWGTPTENKKDSISHGTHATMERHGKAKKTREQVVTIREEYARGGTSYRKLAIVHGIAYCTVRQIVKRQIWKTV